MSNVRRLMSDTNHPQHGYVDELPPIVRTVAAALSSDPDAMEIWLIGSRASGTHRQDSDWDLLLFSRREPHPTRSRCKGVDVLHLGPSGTILLEGQPKAMTVRFESFNWKVVAPGKATYKGLQFHPVQLGTARDEPIAFLVPSAGKLIWSSQ